MNLYGMGSTPVVRFRVVGGLRVGGMLVTFLALLGLSVAAAPDARAMDEGDREAFLNAIAEVETGNDPRAVGRLGERGMFQFCKATWRQYTKRSFFEAHNPHLARQIAAQHFDWLYDGFLRNGRQPTPYLMASAWNAGLSRTLSGRAPKATRNYARRVANITASTSASASNRMVATNRVFFRSGE